MEAGADQSVDEGTSVSVSGSLADPGVLDTHTYHWDFGDGGSATTLAASHTWNDDGVYTATLTVTDDDGGVGTDTLTMTVGDLAPAVVLTGDDTLTEGDTGNFDASGSTSAPDAIVSYEWDFDYDGTFDPSGDTGSTASFTYPDDGAFVTAVRVTDDDGSQSLATLNVSVANAPPAVDAGPDQSGNEGSPLSFTGSFADPGNLDTHTFLWDFGDGNTATTLSATHTYADNGTYTATLTVTDDDGGSGSDSLTVTVGDIGPVANVVGSDSLTEGDTGTFDASSSAPGSPGDTIVSWEWDFDYDGSFDPSGTTGDTALFTFPEDGSPVVAVRVTDDDGAQSVATLNVAVANAPPAVDAGPDQSGPEGDLFSFAGTFSDPGTLDTHTFLWDFGDGSTATTLAPSHTYTDDGVYTATLTVTDDDGGVGSDTLTMTVGDVAPVASLAGSINLTEGDTGSFDASASYAGTPFDSIVAYEWDFDYDGTFDAGGVNTVIATHPFPENGGFTVAVRVTDDDGSQAVATLPVSVSNAAPVVEAGANQAAAPGDVVSLDPATFTDPGVLDTHISLIDWGDGAVEAGAVSQGAGSGSVAGSHAYTAAGTYTVTVTVTDDEGASGSDTLTVVVEAVVVDPPAPSDLDARQKRTKVQLTWTHTGAELYNVYRSDTAGGPYTLIASTTSTYSTYLDEDVITDNTYYYVVRSVVGGNESTVPSNEASATPTNSRTRR